MNDLWTIAIIVILGVGMPMTLGYMIGYRIGGFDKSKEFLDYLMKNGWIKKP